MIKIKQKDIFKITSILGIFLVLSAVPISSAEAKMQNLSETNLPIEIPLTMGYADGNAVYYISTEASVKEVAEHLTDISGFRVTYTPSLQNTPKESLANIYAFTNGIKGTGAFGFQPQVADSQPSDLDYSPLWSVKTVTWKEDSTPHELKSEKEIMDSIDKGQLTIEETGVIVNCPFIKWKDDQLPVREDKDLSDETPYGGGQVLEIDIENLTVTFVAHRGIAPNGDTIYYIATDASSADVAKDLGVIHVPKISNTISTSAASDLYVFTNGLEGNGPLGFQASIGSTTTGDEFYSPLWRIQTATWDHPEDASFVTSINGLQNIVKEQLLSTALAGFVVNCPFVSVDDMMEDNMMSDDMMEDNMVDKNFTPLMSLDLKMMGGHLYSPNMQVTNGINPSDVICKSGLELLMKVSSGDPVCLKPSSIDRLKSIGFADYF